MPDPARQVEQLRHVLEITRYMALTNDLDVLLEMIVAAACEVLACERATVFLYDAASDELYSRVARGVDAIRFPADRGIAGAAARSRGCINVPDAYADPRFNREVDLKTGFRTRNLLTFALENISGDLIGVLQALNKHNHAFDADDEELARILSAQTGVAIDRGRLLEEFVEKQRMQRDLDLARTIQQALFPKRSPELAGYDIAGWNQSADETGGDFYDFVPLAGGRLGVVLADAAGHGISAALVMTQARSLLRAMFSITSDLPRIATAVSRLLAIDLAEERFVTVFVGILDPQTHVLEYISGGQAPILFLSGRAGEPGESRLATGPPFAVLEDYVYAATQRFEFLPGSTLALLTDGFFEAANAERDGFGEERVLQHLSENHAELQDVIASLHGQIRDFVGAQAQADDLTALLIRRRRS